MWEEGCGRRDVGGGLAGKRHAAGGKRKQKVGEGIIEQAAGGAADSATHTTVLNSGFYCKCAAGGGEACACLHTDVYWMAGSWYFVKDESSDEAQGCYDGVANSDTCRLAAGDTSLAPTHVTQSQMRSMLANRRSQHNHRRSKRVITHDRVHILLNRTANYARNQCHVLADIAVRIFVATTLKPFPQQKQCHLTFILLSSKTKFVQDSNVLVDAFTIGRGNFRQPGCIPSKRSSVQLTTNQRNNHSGH